MADASMARLEEDEVELEQSFAAPDTSSDAAVNENDQLDFFITRDGVTYAGSHVIIDLWGADRLDDLAHIERQLRAAAVTAGATVLGSDFHHFQPNGGVSGVVVLAESHISIHTWPERGFAAVDVFMCGDCDPMATVPVLRRAFAPDKVGVNELRRGVMD